MTSDISPVAELLAALSVGERLAEQRARENLALAPDDLGRRHQEHVARRERESAVLLEARMAELASEDAAPRFRPFFGTFFEHTKPADWLEALAWQYVGDALVRDFADALILAVDPVTAGVLEKALADRDEQESYALDEVHRLTRDDPAAVERVAAYARRIVGEALTQTRRALDESPALGLLLGGHEGEKRALLDLLERHRARLDRLGIEHVE